MPRLIKAHKPYIPDNGDVIFMRKFYMEKKPEFPPAADLQPLLFGSLGTNPWRMLGYIRAVDFDQVFELVKKVSYSCPTHNIAYLGAMPVALISRDLRMYKDQAITQYGEGQVEHAFDVGFTRSMNPELNVLNQIDLLRLGHGYDFSRLPSDGYGSLIDLQVEIDNGDIVIFKTWEWYNK